MSSEICKDVKSNRNHTNCADNGHLVFWAKHICVYHIRENIIDLGTGELVTTIQYDHIREVTINYWREVSTLKYRENWMVLYYKSDHIGEVTTVER